MDGNKSVKNGDDYKIKVNKEGIIESITSEDYYNVFMGKVHDSQSCLYPSCC